MTVRAIDTRHGPQLCFDNDHYFWPLLETYGDYNYGEWDLFRQLIQSGDTVVDAGANVGCHTLALAKLVGPTGAVIAFEPQRPLYYALCGTMALNGQWHVQAFNAAVGAEVGTLSMARVDYSAPDMNFGGAFIGEGGGETVPVLPLDHFKMDRVRFIKLDVEGHEIQALNGARETIMQHRPLLYVENDRIENSDALIELLLRMEYRLWLHTPALFNECNFRGSTENLFPNVCAIMLLGVPAEQGFEAEGLREVKGPRDMVKFGAFRV